MEIKIDEHGTPEQQAGEILAAVPGSVRDAIYGTALLRHARTDIARYAERFGLPLDEDDIGEIADLHINRDADSSQEHWDRIAQSIMIFMEDGHAGGKPAPKKRNAHGTDADSSNVIYVSFRKGDGNDGE